MKVVKSEFINKQAAVIFLKKKLINGGSCVLLTIRQVEQVISYLDVADHPAPPGWTIVTFAICVALAAVGVAVFVIVTK